jgi:hypothetical protein
VIHYNTGGTQIGETDALCEAVTAVLQ